MVDLRPGLASFARVSYLRELYGDLPGALEAMQQAASEAGPTPENFAYVSVLVGNLRSLNGDRTGAAKAYNDALVAFPAYAPALAAQGRLAVGDGDLATAIARFRAAADIVPLPEYVIALGEAEEASGDTVTAKQDYDLASVETRLFKANGVVVDLELALFEADHGDRAEALSLARAAYAERHTVRTADALAWALYRNGDTTGALKRAREALRLGSRDPLIRYHAGMIEAAAGQKSRRPPRPPPRAAARPRLLRDGRRPASGGAQETRLETGVHPSRRSLRTPVARHSGRVDSRAPLPRDVDRSSPRRTLVPKLTRVVGIAGALLIAASSAGSVFASSHREAPLTASDPAVDSTDLYAFVSPNDPSKVTIIANYIPHGGPGRRPQLLAVRPQRPV